MKTLSQIKYVRYHPSQNNIYYDLFKLSSVGYPLEISDWFSWNKNIFLIYLPPITNNYFHVLYCHTFCKSFLSIIVNFHLIPIWSESKFSLFIVSLKWEKYVESFLFHDDFLLRTHSHISSSNWTVFFFVFSVFPSSLSCFFVCFDSILLRFLLFLAISSFSLLFAVSGWFVKF